MVDVHALFALAGRGDHRAVAVDAGFFKELVGLLLLDFHASLVEGCLQTVDRVGVKSSAKVASGCRIGYASGSECVEVGFKVSSLGKLLNRFPGRA